MPTRNSSRFVSFDIHRGYAEEERDVKVGHAVYIWEFDSVGGRWSLGERCFWLMCRGYCILAMSEAIRRFRTPHTEEHVTYTRTTARIRRRSNLPICWLPRFRGASLPLFVAQVDRVIDSAGMRLKTCGYIAPEETRSTFAASIMADTRYSLSSLTSVSETLNVSVSRPRALPYWTLKISSYIQSIIHSLVISWLILLSPSHTLVYLGKRGHMK